MSKEYTARSVCPQDACRVEPLGLSNHSVHLCSSGCFCGALLCSVVPASLGAAAAAASGSRSSPMLLLLLTRKVAVFTRSMLSQSSNKGKHEAALRNQIRLTEIYKGVDEKGPHPQSRDQLAAGDSSHVFSLDVHTHHARR